MYNTSCSAWHAGGSAFAELSWVGGWERRKTNTKMYSLTEPTPGRVMSNSRSLGHVFLHLELFCLICMGS